MSSPPAGQFSGSEGEPGLAIDERKRKRMQSNRESARRSRMRKQQHVDDLVNQAAELKNQNSQILMQIELITQRYVDVESDNTILRTRMMELTDRLQGLNSVLHIFKEVNGMAMDIPEIPEQILEPWQLQFPAMPIPASANLSQY